MKGLGMPNTAIAVCTTAAILLGVAGVSHAAPRFVRLSYTGDTTTTMTVAWNTTGPADTEVRYGTAAGALGQTVTGTSFKANAGLDYVHEATLHGLKPSTTYYYVVGSAADGFSPEKRFTTGPLQHEQCGRFRFAFLGDNRPDPTFGGGENWPQILGQSVGQQPAFVLNGGDLVIDGDRVDQWVKFLEWTEPVASLLPFMPAIGNHDNGPGEGDTANYNQLFALPRSTGPHGSNTEDYYFFTYGNAIFVSLSTEGFKGGSSPFAEQAAWLDEVLTQNPRRWKFVFLHKPIYTHEAFFDISHPPNEAGQNAAWVAVFDKHHVDVVLTSHNHWYERFEPSACGTQGNPGSEQPCSVGATNYAGGTVYYVSGGAGAFTIPGLLCGLQGGRAQCSGEHHYLVAEIDNERLKIDTWAAFPEQNRVIDSITITKGAVPCGGAQPQDAGPADSAPLPDAGVFGPDASPSTSTPDSGGSTADAGSATDPTTEQPASESGGGCQATGGRLAGLPTLLLAALALGGLRRRRRRR